eukprot:COSAG01_NODE_145_length_24103_cov_41.178012_13_plen_209_part_00
MWWQIHSPGISAPTVFCMAASQQPASRPAGGKSQSGFLRTLAALFSRNRWTQGVDLWALWTATPPPTLQVTHPARWAMEDYYSKPPVVLYGATSCDTCKWHTQHGRAMEDYYSKPPIVLYGATVCDTPLGVSHTERVILKKDRKKLACSCNLAVSRAAAHNSAAFTMSVKRTPDALSDGPLGLLGDATNAASPPQVSPCRGAARSFPC